tara:strand:+ start:1424 stop:1900 length:477 start_codon:yes stop_codon:yes gene_type:complete
MASLLGSVQKALSPYYFYIVVGVVVIIFIIVAFYYLQNRQKQEEQKRFEDVANENLRTEDATVMFFNADWCPHCKSAKPEWDAFVSQNDKRVLNGYKIKCVNVNCTDESDSDVASMMDKYKIESFPTVKMLKKNQVIEFDSKITSSALESFMNIMLAE